MSPEPTTPANARRSDVTFSVGRDSCAAWLYRPANVERPPVIVMAHGFGAIRTLRLDAYAQCFADAGYAVLVFDYRHFGDSTGQPRELLSLSRQQQDWRAAIAYARTLPGIDTGRVIAWGSSLSGGHVLHTAARDHNLAAVIAQVTENTRVVYGTAAAAGLPARPGMAIRCRGAIRARSPHGDRGERAFPVPREQAARLCRAEPATLGRTGAGQLQRGPGIRPRPRLSC